MKKYLLILFLISSLKGFAFYINSEQKIYPSLLNKNFILIANLSYFEPIHDVGPPRVGIYEIFSFQNKIISELVRDYVDRYYRFEKKTILYMNPDVEAYANILSVKKDTILFQYLKDWIQDNDNDYFYFSYDIKNTLRLVDYAVNHVAEIAKKQKICQFEDPNTAVIDTILSVSPEVILEILRNRSFVSKVDAFLRNTKKYSFKSQQFRRYDNYILNNDRISCYYQNDSFHFFNKKDGKVFFVGKEIRQFAQIGSANFLIKVEDDMIYNYNSNTGKLSVFLYPDCYYKNIYIENDAAAHSFRIIGGYKFFIEHENDFYIGMLLGSVRHLGHEYTYQDTNKLPVLTKMLDRNEAYNHGSRQKPIIQKETNTKIFPFLAFLFLLWVSISFIRINLVKN